MNCVPIRHSHCSVSLQVILILSSFSLPVYLTLAALSPELFQLFSMDIPSGYLHFFNYFHSISNMNYLPIVFFPKTNSEHIQSQSYSRLAESKKWLAGVLVTQFSTLFPVDFIKELDLLSITPSFLPLAPAVLPVRLHRVRNVDVDAVSIWIGWDQQWVRSCLAQVTWHEAVLTAWVAQRWGSGVGRWLADVWHNGHAVHGFLVVTDLQDLQVDLHIGVAHTPRSWRSTPIVATCVMLLCTGLMAHRLGAVNFHLLGIVGRDFEAITANLIGRKGQRLACGCMEGHGALEGTKRDGQPTCACWSLWRNTVESKYRVNQCWYNEEINLYFAYIASISSVELLSF